MNTALVEMANLLPSPAIAAKENSNDGNNGSGEASTGVKSPEVSAQGGVSKAATVECAIEYIRALKKDAEEKEREFQALKDRLREAEKKLEGIGMSEGVK